MKKPIRLIITLWLAICSLHAVPLTWRFSGTTGASSQHNGSNIGGLAFELRIFLDTDLGVLDPLSLADFFFTGPHQGEVQIDTIGVLPVNTFGNVQYFAPGGLITGLQFNQPAFSDITFAASIGNDPLHLFAIPPTTPTVDSSLEGPILGPNGLALFSSTVTTFSATLEENGGSTPVPDVGSTALLVLVGLGGLTLLRQRR